MNTARLTIASKYVDINFCHSCFSTRGAIKLNPNRKKTIDTYPNIENFR